jgi:hypothetical protein
MSGKHRKNHRKDMDRVDRLMIALAATWLVMLAAGIVLVAYVF